MERRKFLIGAGALAAGSAAAVGTGAFTSVTANRGLEVQVADDANALLAINGVPGSENSDYVDFSGDAVSIDISTANGNGLNNNATTRIKDLLRIENRGTQEVYVWASGLPTDPRVAMSAQPSSSFQNMASKGTTTEWDGETSGENGAGGTGNTGPGGAFSENSSIDPTDVDGDESGSDGDEAAPLLAPGDYVDVELFAYGDLTGLDFDSDIVINAVDADQVD